jgi:4-amino-4-deoxychorismate lyase
MSLLFETIKVKDGNFCNLHYHSERMNNARRNLFDSPSCTDLELILTVPENYKTGIIKCRVEYNYYINKIEFIPYNIRKISTLQLVYDDVISYQFKYSDRSCFERLKKKTNTDDIVIVKNGFITDSSFSNIIFFDGNKWITPSTTLLKGIKRKELLEKRIISEKEIRPCDLKYFKKAMLINAMLDFNESPEIDIKNIFF